jgi:hypothetical protein
MIKADLNEAGILTPRIDGAIEVTEGMIKGYESAFTPQKLAAIQKVLHGKEIYVCENCGLEIERFGKGPLFKDHWVHIAGRSKFCDSSKKTRAAPEGWKK